MSVSVSFLHLLFSKMRVPISSVVELKFSAVGFPLTCTTFVSTQAVSLLAAGSVATSGVVVNETILAEKSFSNRDPGTYAASLIGDAPLDVPTEYVEGDNTLRIDLGSTPVRERLATGKGRVSAG